MVTSACLNSFIATTRVINHQEQIVSNMRVQDSEQQFSEEMENLGDFNTGNEEDSKTLLLNSPPLKLEMSSNDGDAPPQFENREKDTILDHIQLRNSFPVRIKISDFFYAHWSLIFHFLLFCFISSC